MKNKMKFLIIFIIYLTGISCDSVETEEITIDDDGSFLRASIMKDSIVVEGIDTIRILHGEFEIREFHLDGKNTSGIRTNFRNGYIDGELILESKDGVYEGKFHSEGVNEFFDDENSFTEVAISEFINEEYFQFYFKNQFIKGQIGIPVGKHVLKRNDSIIVEMEFENGLPIGIWKAMSKLNKFDFLEFDSGKVSKEYTLLYENKALIKRLEGNREIIYENGVEVATIVKVHFDCYNGGVKLSVPSDKMWTPLYFEAQTKDFFYRKPQIYPKKSSRGRGWLKSESFYFPEKKDFQSYKISKQNYKAIYGDGEQAVLVDCNGNVRYTAFFYEEFK